MYFVRIVYNDDTPDDFDQYETADEACEAYQDAIEARADLGPSGFGDCARICWGFERAGKRTVRASKAYA